MFVRLVYCSVYRKTTFSGIPLYFVGCRLIVYTCMSLQHSSYQEHISNICYGSNEHTDVIDTSYATRKRHSHFQQTLFYLRCCSRKNNSRIRYKKENHAKHDFDVANIVLEQQNIESLCITFTTVNHFFMVIFFCKKNLTDVI